MRPVQPLYVAIFVALVAAAGSSALVRAAAPPEMKKNAFALTEAAATLDVCFNSPSFKQLSYDQIHRFIELDFRLTELVEAIGTHFADEGVVYAYFAMRPKIAAEPELQRSVARKFSGCTEKLYTEMAQYVAETERIIYGALRGKR